MRSFLIQNFKKSATEFNAWRRAEHSEVQCDGIDLTDRDLSEYDIRDFHFRSCTFDRCLFTQKQMMNVKFENCSLNKARFVSIKMENVSFAISEMKEATFEKCEFKSISFRNADLTSASFVGNSYQGTSFDHVKLISAEMSGENLSGLNLRYADFSKCSLIRTQFVSAHLEDAIFFDANLEYSSFNGARADRTQFPNAKLVGSNFSTASCVDGNFISADLTDAILDSANFTNSTLSKALLVNAKLRGTCFDGASLRSADLSGAIADSKTILSRADVSGTIVDSYMLAMLNDQYGGLTKGDRILLTINDDVAKLRQSFSGFIGIIHYIALLLFALPYCIFLVKSYMIAKFSSNPETGHTILSSLGMYIWSGGRSSHSWEFHPTFLLFAFLIIYNCVRAVLIWKTKMLEWKQEVTGLPVMFSLKTSYVFHGEHIPWQCFYNIGKYGFYLNIAIVVWHTCNFMMMRIPY